MDESNKLPLKRVELSLTKFNEVAIPHHLDLLRQHKANIIKHEGLGELSRVRTEQTHAARVAARLRALLAEMDALRRQVRAADLPRFDDLTQRSRDLTLRAIMDYLDSPPPAISPRRRVEEGAGAAGSFTSTDSVGVISRDEDEPPPLRLQVDDREVALQEREAVLRGWGALQHEVRALHDAWRHVQAAALAQRESTQHAAAAVERADADVSAARAHLGGAVRLRALAWGAGGAALGAAAGGPVGLAVGAKAGALAALAGSVLGYCAARLAARGTLARDGAAPAPAAAAAEGGDKRD